MNNEAIFRLNSKTDATTMTITAIQLRTVANFNEITIEELTDPDSEFQHYLVPGEVFDVELHWARRPICESIEADGFVALVGESTYENGPAHLDVDYPEFDNYLANFDS